MTSKKDFYVSSENINEESSDETNEISKYRCKKCKKKLETVIT